MILLRTFIVVLLLTCGLTVGVVAAKSSSNFSKSEEQSSILTDNKPNSFKNQANEIEEVETPEQAIVNNGEDPDSLEVSNIVVSLKEQRFYAFNGSGRLIFKYPISSGRGGMGTPTGKFRIWYKATATVSRKYNAMMYHWMAFTSSGSHGFHGLAGRSYYNHLGSPASHGCVRLAREDAREVYPHVKIGTPVEIVRGGLFEPVLHEIAPITQNPEIAKAKVSSKSTTSRSRRNKSSSSTTAKSKPRVEPSEPKPSLVEAKPQQTKPSEKSESSDKSKDQNKGDTKPKEDAPKQKPDESSDNAGNDDGEVFF